MLWPCNPSTQQYNTLEDVTEWIGTPRFSLVNVMQTIHCVHLERCVVDCKFWWFNKMNMWIWLLEIYFYTKVICLHIFKMLKNFYEWRDLADDNAWLRLDMSEGYRSKIDTGVKVNAGLNANLPGYFVECFVVGFFPWHYLWLCWVWFPFYLTY